MQKTSENGRLIRICLPDHLIDDLALQKLRICKERPLLFATTPQLQCQVKDTTPLIFNPQGQARATILLTTTTSKCPSRSRLCAPVQAHHNLTIPNALVAYRGPHIFSLAPQTHGTCYPECVRWSMRTKSSTRPETPARLISRMRKETYRTTKQATPSPDSFVP